MAEKRPIVRTDSLSTDRIDGSFDADYISCPICSNVLWKPIACQTCENTFCKKCIRLWLKDNPNKCPFQCRFQERKPPPILLKILSKIQLACRNKTNGCPSVCSYEALEKHEQQECGFRLIQCLVCSKEMLQNDSESHAADECSSKEVTCLKCGSVYQQRDGHVETQCLKAQITLLEEKLRDQENKPKKVMENYNKMVDLHNRSTSVSSNNCSTVCAATSPSAPPAEEKSMPTKSLRISTIDFSGIPRTTKPRCPIPNGYAGFIWENARYADRHIASIPCLAGFRMAFRDSQKYVAYNDYDAALTLYLPNPGNKFDLHSFEAISVRRPTMKLFIKAYRSELVIDVKDVMLVNELRLFEIDWEGIDRLVFSNDGIVRAGEPATFALSALNLVL